MQTVVFVADNACIRVTKLAYAAKAAGYNVRYLCRNYGAPDLMSFMGDVGGWTCVDELARMLAKQCDGTEIFHVCPEPAGLAKYVRAAHPSAAVVLDVHDSDWGRGLKLKVDEMSDEMAADSIIVPSSEYLQRYYNAFGARKYCVVIYSAVPDYVSQRYAGLSKMPRSIGYEGGLDVGGWRDYRELFAMLTDAGAAVIAYSPAVDRVHDQYIPTGAIITTRPYRKMMSCMSRHEWALVCPAQDGNEPWRSAMPNKFFEACWVGVPVLTYGCDEASAFVKRYGCGLSFEDRAGLVRWVMDQYCAPSPAHIDGCNLVSFEVSMRCQAPRVRAAYNEALLARDSRQAAQGGGIVGLMAGIVTT